MSTWFQSYAALYAAVPLTPTVLRVMRSIASFALALLSKVPPKPWNWWRRFFATAESQLHAFLTLAYDENKAPQVVLLHCPSCSCVTPMGQTVQDHCALPSLETCANRCLPTWCTGPLPIGKNDGENAIAAWPKINCLCFVCRFQEFVVYLFLLKMEGRYGLQDFLRKLLCQHQGLIIGFNPMFLGNY